MVNLLSSEGREDFLNTYSRTKEELYIFLDSPSIYDHRNVPKTLAYSLGRIEKGVHLLKVCRRNLVGIISSLERQGWEPLKVVLKGV